MRLASRRRAVGSISENAKKCSSLRLSSDACDLIVFMKRFDQQSHYVFVSSCVTEGCKVIVLLTFSEIGIII